MKIQMPIINRFDAPRSDYRIDNNILSKWNPNLKTEKTNNTIEIFQEIGESIWGEGFTARRMSAALRSIGEDKDIVVSINSPGGDFFEGATIYNQLREHKGKVTVKVIGLAASAASIIAMAGDEIQISDIGFIMIHDAWGLVMGNKNDMRKSAEVFDSFDSAIADVYAKRTKIEKNKIAKMMDNDTWLNASDSIEKGFADSIMNEQIEEEDEDKKSKALARRTVESSLAKSGFSRKERYNLLKEAFDASDSVDAVASDSYNEESVKQLLKTMRGE